MVKNNINYSYLLGFLCVLGCARAPVREVPQSQLEEIAAKFQTRFTEILSADPNIKKVNDIDISNVKFSKKKGSVEVRYSYSIDEPSEKFGTVTIEYQAQATLAERKTNQWYVKKSMPVSQRLTFPPQAIELKKK